MEGPAGGKKSNEVAKASWAIRLSELWLEQVAGEKWLPPHSNALQLPWPGRLSDISRVPAAPGACILLLVWRRAELLLRIGLLGGVGNRRWRMGNEGCVDASWDPFHKSKPLAITSILRSSQRWTELMFGSDRRVCIVTRAPASLQTLAAAFSSGAPWARSTPDGGRLPGGRPVGQECDCDATGKCAQTGVGGAEGGGAGAIRRFGESM